MTEKEMNEIPKGTIMLFGEMKTNCGPKVPAYLHKYKYIIIAPTPTTVNK